MRVRPSSVLIARLMFGALLLLEALNYVHVLHFTIVYTWLGLLLTAGGVWAIMEITHHRKPHDAATWFLAFGIVALDALGDMLHLYAILPHFDKYMHFFNSAMGALVIFLYILKHRRAMGAWEYWATWSSLMAFGALYELEEFWESVLFHTNRWGGGSDTLTDMTANAFGASVALLVSALILRRRSSARISSKSRGLSR